ncbi:hypothetical protein CJ030_MR7G013584 [Morella rubra]|uniref:K-box domain-containing protein n=1 Tax=Morella rubra TaxID=262757 RepID=A0A6A1V1V6_9ROSI|nr:hypothetical protein CJ030_MR7G013584 [Morella rubra]
MDQQSLELQLENDTYTVLSKEILEKTHELRKVKGEELDGLNTKELQELEKMVHLSLRRVVKKKDEMFLNEITALKQKVIGRYNLHSENLYRMDQRSLELQLENDTYTTVLSKEILEKTHELRKLWMRFKGNDLPPEKLGSSKEYNADMIPKFMMANGKLVHVLIHIDVTKYLLYFKAVDSSFVYNKVKVIGRYNLHSDQNLNRTDQQSLELQLENDTYTVLSKEILEKTHELRKVKGEELEGLNTKELQELEKMVHLSLRRVVKKKDEMFLNEITALKQKMQDVSVKAQVLEQGHSCHESSDTALKLGLPFPD